MPSFGKKKEKAATHWVCKCPRRMPTTILWCSKCGAAK